MTTSSPLLGIECGGTRTVALLVAGQDQLLQRMETGAANARLLTDTQLAAHFRALAAALPTPAALGIGMAGVREESDRRRVRACAARAWPGVPCWAGNDLETAWEAAGRPSDPSSLTRIIVISGTGSCCYGCRLTGPTAKVGGWGHLLGDQGSGYDIALGALRRLIHGFDTTGRWPRFGRRLLQVLLLNEPNDLVTWVHLAEKADIAALTKDVFGAAARGDAIARAVLAEAAMKLADAGAACARRLTRSGQPVEFVLVGGVVQRQAAFARRLRSELQRRWPGATVRLLERESAWGAVMQARRLLPEGSAGAAARASGAWGIPEPDGLSPTEQRNPRSLDLDRRPIRSAVELMLSEDARIPLALLRERDHIARAVRMIVAAFRRGGRLFYVGAGTSGRLGVLDASECPPTFRAPPEQVQGILAGGQAALWTSVEGAEDDAEAGARAVRFRGVTAKDVVMGIAASGRTPFVWGALHTARKLGAPTILLSFNPNLRFARHRRPDLVIAPNVGPEVLTGSTRLKAGTGTKLVLNILTTLSMVQLGKVKSNLMVDLNPANSKLRDRAVRIVRELTGVDAPTATAALERAGWVVKSACGMLTAPCRSCTSATRRRGSYSPTRYRTSSPA